MKTRRFFVTYAVILGMCVLLASSAISLFKMMSVAQNPSPDSLAQAGNEKIQRVLTLRDQLRSQYGLVIAADSEKGEVKNLVATARQFNWKALTKPQRRDIQAQLALYLSLINQVLFIDAQKNVTIEHRENLLLSRDSAEAFQKAIENFEQVYGENYRPRGGLI